MNIKNIKTRCTKQRLSKCEDICRTYNKISEAFALLLESSDEVKSFRTNVYLENFSEGEYTSDFLIVKTNGETAIRECISRDTIARPKNARLLDCSRIYWQERGIGDWGIVVDERTV